MAFKLLVKPILGYAGYQFNNMNYGTLALSYLYKALLNQTSKIRTFIRYGHVRGKVYKKG